MQAIEVLRINYFCNVLYIQLNAKKVLFIPLIADWHPDLLLHFHCYVQDFFSFQKKKVFITFFYL